MLTQELRNRYSQANSESGTPSKRDIHSVMYERTPNGKMRVSMNKLNQSYTNGFHSSPNRSNDFAVFKSHHGKVFMIKILANFPKIT